MLLPICDLDKKKKGFGDSLTNLLGTFGLKKGRALKTVGDNIALDKDAAVCGMLHLLQNLYTGT